MTHMPFFHKTLFADVSVQLFTLVRLLVRLLVSCVQIIINPKQSYSARKKSEMLHYNPTNVEIQGVPAHTY